ncbi:hypothetical protein [Xylanibacter muris]|uniref:Uncharacterized protein n=1 Tax=Xylanibacter muris TaxID=2736290 RepID=A0ABX2ANA1_9BACT|nr:hypothetical protein [Xylanibacter muris]NPD91675.1 hypothetical protein [Xylanibacter muris]
MNDEIKEWKTQTVKNKVAGVLMMDGVSFNYTEENGIMFTAPESYVKCLVYRLKVVFGCRRKPIIEEY